MYFLRGPLEHPVAYEGHLFRFRLSLRRSQTMPVCRSLSLSGQSRKFSRHWTVILICIVDLDRLALPCEWEFLRSSCRSLGHPHKIEGNMMYALLKSECRKVRLRCFNLLPNAVPHEISEVELSDTFGVFCGRFLSIRP